jgi:hypothetical protein
MMPLHPHAPTRPSGEPYTVDDREFWEYAEARIPHAPEIGGVRQRVHLEWPKMIYKARNGRSDPESFETQVVQSESHLTEIRRKDPAWQVGPTEASEFYEGLQRDIARAAAETAASVERMTEPAKRQYRKRSADSPTHVTE